MDARRNMDGLGAVCLIGVSLILGLNQVVIKIGNGGFQPVFAAGLRSLGAMFCLLLWMRWRGIAVRVAPGSLRPGLLLGLLFSVEFMLLFVALDLTTVARTSVIFYSMPVWLGLAAHVLLPGEAMTRVKALGLALALCGVALAMVHRSDGGAASLTGDLCALGAALCWTAIALTARSGGMQGVRPEMQLLWQTGLSGPLLILMSLAFGPWIRDLAPIHLAALAFQIVVVAMAGFLIWFWLLTRHPAGQVAAFGFLAPVFGAWLGWALLDERLGPVLLVALLLVVAGLVLINRPPDGFRFRRRSV